MRPGLVMCVAGVMVVGACSSSDPEVNTFKVPGTDAVVVIPDVGLDLGSGDASATDKLSLVSVKPTHGPFVGGTKLTLRGTGFSKTCKVEIGGKNIQVGQTKVAGPLSMTVVTPAGTPGAVDVKVTCGAHNVRLINGYAYDSVFMDPSSGPTAGGTLVKIFGTSTSFASGMKLSLGGKAMTEVTVAGATAMSAKTPAGTAGLVELVVGDSKGTSITVKEAFNYYVSTNPKSGGLGGGPIKGTLTVSVLDSATRAPIDGAAVLVQDSTQTLFTGKTGSSGVLVFSKIGFYGPVNVTAGKTKYESTTVVNMDARDVTILLVQIAEPGSGPGPPPLLTSTIKGHLFFGGSTGAGTSAWKIVPEPLTGEVKRAYIHRSITAIGTTLPTLDKVPYVDYDPTAKLTAWPYSTGAVPGIQTVYALAGLYNKTTDVFTPHAMGLKRGVVVGPGGVATNVNILIEVPLNRTITVQLKDVPSSSKIHKVRLGIDLGAEGFLVRLDNEVTGTTGVPVSAAFTRMPPFSYQGLTDASWAVDTALDGGGTVASPSLPYVRGTSRSMKDTAGVLIMDKYVGPGLLVDPPIAQYLKDNTLKWTSTGSPADLILTRIVLNASPPTPVWRIISRGKATEVKLPDPKAAGLNDWTAGKLYIWAHWAIHLHPGYNFDKYNYDHLYSRYWDRWSQQQSYFQLQTTTTP